MTPDKFDASLRSEQFDAELEREQLEASLASDTLTATLESEQFDVALRSEQFTASLSMQGPPGPPMGVQDEGVALSPYNILNFTGDGVTAAPDGPRNRIDVNVPGQTPWTQDIDAGGFHLIGAGLIESADGGVKFPDGTIQITASQGIEGPQGPAGIQGVPGPEGPVGPIGPAGPQGTPGATGETGATGPMGPEGPQGLQGAAGATGEPGAPGPQGIQGTPGAQGPEGLQGPVGPTGPEGPQGPAGVGINLQGTVPTYDDLPDGTSGQVKPGDAWITEDTGELWVWQSTGPTDPGHWVNAGDITGPQGPQGVQGPVGPMGPQGEQGPMGPAGAQGATGDTGATGATGPEGPQGAQGVQGVTGLTGAEGPQGIQGPVGPAGPQGEPGPIGPQGIAGIQGPVGPAGAQGATGLQGPIGPVGPEGPAGADGADGVDGAVGPAGPAGPLGPPGIPGPQGPEGPAGATGATGPAGVQGPKGDTGAQGPMGATGATGAQGAMGPAGATGATGATGPAGAAGPQGEPGVPGIPNYVQDEGVTLPARVVMNFAGAGVTVTDDSASGRTVVTIPGGGAGSQTPWTQDINAANFSLYNVGQDISHSNDTEWHFYSSVAQPTLFYTAGVERLRITANGNVGIGTTGPLMRLHVDGVIHTYQNVPLDTPSGSVILSRAWAADNNTRASSIFHFYSTATFMDHFAIGVSGDGGGSYDRPDAIARIKMVVRADGHVGIGTTAPEATLHVIDSLIASPVSGQIKGNVYIAGNGPWGLQFGHLGNGTTWAQAQRSDGIGSLYNLALNPLGGGVGIGELSPAAACHIVKHTGGPNANWYDPANFAGVVHHNINSTQCYGLLVSHRYLAAESIAFAVDGRFTTGGGSVGEDQHYPRFIVRGDGNCGIGTANPTQRLDVEGNIRVATYLYVGAHVNTTANVTTNAPSHIAMMENGDNWIRWQTLAQFKTFLGSGSQTPWVSNIDANNFQLNGVRRISVAAAQALSGYQQGAMEIREALYAGAADGSANYAPRIGFHWGGRVASQIGMDASGVIRTYNNPGTGYEAFACGNCTVTGNLVCNGNIRFPGAGQGVIYQYGGLAWYAADTGCVLYSSVSGSSAAVFVGTTGFPYNAVSFYANGGATLGISWKGNDGVAHYINLTNGQIPSGA